MTRTRIRRRAALVVVAAPFLLASCTKKEEPPPAPQAAPSAAPSTTIPPPTPTPVPTPPPVWRSARWGMTRAEVLAAFPREAQRLDRPADFAKPQPGSILAAGSSDIAIPTYDADGATFRVLFGYEADALKRVHLAAVKPRAETCGDLEKALTERHSAPSQRASTGSSLKGEEIVWTLPDQTIVLSCGGVFRLGFVTVTLDYMAPD
jgi:hypothetical protein